MSCTTSLYLRMTACSDMPSWLWEWRGVHCSRTLHMSSWIWRLEMWTRQESLCIVTTEILPALNIHLHINLYRFVWASKVSSRRLHQSKQLFMSHWMGREQMWRRSVKPKYYAIRWIVWELTIVRKAMVHTSYAAKMLIIHHILFTF